MCADAIELHPEVLQAAQRFFGLRPALHGGRAWVGDAAALVPRLASSELGRKGGAAGGKYDYILHDIFRCLLPPATLCTAHEQHQRVVPLLHAAQLTPQPLRPPWCSGGGMAPALMGRPFFRQLSASLAPGGVLAVNYYGGRGQGLKAAWCRLRLEFASGAARLMAGTCLLA